MKTIQKTLARCLTMLVLAIADFRPASGIPVRLLPRRLRRALGIRLLRMHGYAPVAGGATIVAQRSGLYWNSVRGGLPFISDATKITGNVFFVDSAAAGASDTAGHGYSPDKPFATIDFAIGQCSENQGDVILVLPGHTETVSGAAGINCDKAGVSIVGLGTGAARPTITLSAVASTVAIGAANVTLKNLLFLFTAASTIGIDVNDNDCTLEDCELRESTAQAVTYIDVNGGGANAADRFVLRRCKIQSETANSTQAVEIGAVQDGIVIEDCWITGDFSVAGIHSGSICTNMLIRRNVIRNVNAGDFAIELTAAATGLAVDNRFYANAAATCFDPGSLMCIGNRFALSIDQESSHIVPLWPAAAVPANGAALEAVIRDIWDAVRNGTGGTEPGANKSLVDAIGFDGAAAVAASAGMLRTAAGTLFQVTKTVVANTIVLAGIDLTGVSAGGAILIEDVIFQVDGTAMDSAGAAVAEVYTNNVLGSASIWTAAKAKLVANAVVDGKNATTASKVVLETGKKASVKATTADFNTAGSVMITLICRRLADGASLAAV